MSYAVVHFEMPYQEEARVSAFYKDAFGWTMQSAGPDMGNYILAGTTESGPDGRPSTPGAINGGFFAKNPDTPAQYPSVVIAVPDIQAAIAAVADAGGEILGEPMEIPGVGSYVSFTDTEGNRVSLLQPTTPAT
jgi:predicted enzyme related to lactoylglutathione lyase